MAVIVGIDEAGYGPLLGPLVVSSACFSLPDGILSSSLWDVLSDAVYTRKTGSKGRILVNDSKKLHKGIGDNSVFIRSIFAFLAAASNSASDMHFPANFKEFAESVNYTDFMDYNDYPWYQNILEEKIAFDSSELAIAATSLWRTMKKKNVKLEYLKALPMLVGKYNDAVDLTGNKAVVLFNMACTHIFYAWEKFAGQNLNIVVDKQGGRANYRDKLQKLFPYARVNELKQTPVLSSYHIFEGNRSMKIHFIAKGDQKQLPVALASMVSKLFRELMVDQMNNFYIGKIGSLKPTAGYYQDGMRFLGELKQNNMYPGMNLARLLIRNK